MAIHRKTQSRKKIPKATIFHLNNIGMLVRETGRIQTIYSVPRRKWVEQYLTPKGRRLLLSKKISEKEAYRKYGKNRYVNNPEAVPIKVIVHRI